MHRPTPGHLAGIPLSAALPFLSQQCGTGPSHSSNRPCILSSLPSPLHEHVVGRLHHTESRSVHPSPRVTVLTLERTYGAPLSGSWRGYRAFGSLAASVVAGLLWTLVSPETAFIYLGAWMLIALATLPGAR